MSLLTKTVVMSNKKRQLSKIIDPKFELLLQESDNVKYPCDKSRYDTSFIKRSINYDSDIYHDTQYYYFKNINSLCNLLTTFLLNFPSDICILIAFLAFEKQINYRFGRFLTIIECDNNNVNFTQNNQCDLETIGANCRFTQAFFVLNHFKYGDCIITIDIGYHNTAYNIFLFDKQKWLFKKNEQKTLSIHFGYGAKCLLFNDNLLVASRQEYLYFFDLIKLDSPYFLKKYKIKTNNTEYPYEHHAMQCIEKTENQIIIIVSSGKANEYFFESFMKFSIYFKNEISIIEEKITFSNIIGDMTLLKYGLLSNLGYDMILNNKNERIFIMIRYNCIIQFNYDTSELSIKPNVCFYFHFLVVYIDIIALIQSVWLPTFNTPAFILHKDHGHVISQSNHHKIQYCINIIAPKRKKNRCHKCMDSVTNL